MAERKKAAARTTVKAGRLDKSTWVESGLELLAKSGVESVRIDELCRLLGVTKGSFYWHFKDRAQLLGAMLETWRRSATLAVIARLESDGSPAQRLRHIINLPIRGGAKRGQNIELAVRLWANHDPNAAAALEEIDQHRLAYVVSQLRASGLSEAKAGARAYLIYAFVLAESFIPARAAAQFISSATLQRLAGELISGDILT